MRQETHPDTIEIAEVLRTLRRGWRTVLGWFTVGVAASVGILWFVPPRYEGKATVLVRPSLPGGSSIIAKLTGLGDLVGGDLGGVNTPLETELQVLRSRSLAAEVVDSFRLQFRVREPRSLPGRLVVQSAMMSPLFAPRDYRFERIDASRYRVSGPGAPAEVVTGQPAKFDIGTITLSRDSLPAEFTMRVYDRTDAVTRFAKRTNIGKTGGDVVRVTYQGDDSVTAAAAANALVSRYLELRRTVDRGTNQRRVEFLAAQLDSAGAQLTATERQVRRQQESSGVLDAITVGKVTIENAGELRKMLVEIQVEEGAIAQLLAEVDAGRVSPRQLAAHPAFVKGTSLTPLIGQLGDLESQRNKLMERRTEKDPEVLALGQSIKSLEAQFLGSARSYYAALKDQHATMNRQLDSLRNSLLALPEAAESGGRLQRDVLRLTQIYAGVQAQLVDARLSAIGEGGQVRQLDEATVSRKPSFPTPLLTLGIGSAMGLIIGLVMALLFGGHGRWLRDPLEIERATGMVAQQLDGVSPLMVASGATAQTVLVVPVEQRAESRLVAQRLQRTALSRAINATILDLSGTNGANNGAGHASVTQSIESLEKQYGMVIVQLPELSSEATAAALRESRPVLLVAPSGRVSRARLEQAVQTLRRLQIPCAGIVISESPTGRLT